MREFSFDVLGLGAWGPRFRNWADLQALLTGHDVEDDGSKGPKPEVIPANERRRAPLPVRLAVETSTQACQSAVLDPKQLASVFVSGLGDTQLTDYMCKVLAGDNKALSPTKFHNSVHNAAAGYWTISTDCMQAANSVAGYAESVALTLTEALVQADLEKRPLLLTFYDAPTSPILRPLLKNEHPFAVSIVISPSHVTSERPAIASLRAKVSQGSSTWPKRSWGAELQACYEQNPVARILPFLEMILGIESKLTMPLSSATSLQVVVGD